MDHSSSGQISCSICLDFVQDNGVRSMAKLKCGHQFHLDCIGSAFNVKGEMQCPNCREVEDGQWLYVNGPTRSSVPEFSVEADWAPDEDIYDMGYTELPFRFHWCPFGEATQMHSSFESDRRGESSFPASFDTLPEPIARAHARVQVFHDHHRHHHHHRRHHHHHHHLPQQHRQQQSIAPPAILSTRRFDGQRSLPAATVAAPPPLPRDHNAGFYIFPPSSSSDRNTPEAERPSETHFHGCGRGREPPHHPIAFPERDPSWVPSHHSYAGHDSGNRSGTIRNGPRSS